MTSPNYGNVKAKFDGKRGKRKISSRLENALNDKNEDVSSKDGENVLSDSYKDGIKTHDFLRNLVHEQKSNAPTLFCNDKMPLSTCGKFDSREMEVVTAKRICEANAVSLVSLHQRENQSFPNGNLNADLNSQSENSGKLRFYFGGRCVLELVHSSGDSTASTWTQAKGSIRIPPAVKCDEQVNIDKSTSEFCSRKITRTSSPQSPPSSASVDIGRTRNVPLFTLRINRNRCSTGLPNVSTKLVRKAARNLRLNLHSLSLAESSKLTSVLPRRKLIRRTKTLSGCFRLSKFFNRKELEVNCVINQPNGIFIGHETTEHKFVNATHSKKDGQYIERNGIRPLPDWYLDPSKAQVPLSEMIGYPRPYLPIDHHPSVKLENSGMWTKNCIQVNRAQGENDENHWKLDTRVKNCDRETISEKDLSGNEIHGGNRNLSEVPKGRFFHVGQKNDLKDFSSLHQHLIRPNKNYFSDAEDHCEKDVSITTEEQRNSPNRNTHIKNEHDLVTEDHPLDLSIHGRQDKSEFRINRSDNPYYSSTIRPHTLMCNENKIGDEYFRLDALNTRHCALSCGCNRVDRTQSPPPPPPVALPPWPLVAYTPTVVNSYYYCCCFLPDCPRFNCNFDNSSSMHSANLIPCSHISKCSPIAHGKTCSTQKIDLNLIAKNDTNSADRESSMLKELLMKPTDE